MSYNGDQSVDMALNLPNVIFRIRMYILRSLKLIEALIHSKELNNCYD